MTDPTTAGVARALSAEDAAELLGVTAHWLKTHWLKTHREDLPHIFIGRRIRFLPEHIDEIQRLFEVRPFALGPAEGTAKVGPVPVARRRQR